MGRRRRRKRTLTNDKEEGRVEFLRRGSVFTVQKRLLRRHPVSWRIPRGIERLNKLRRKKEVRDEPLQILVERGKKSLPI